MNTRIWRIAILVLVASIAAASAQGAQSTARPDNGLAKEADSAYQAKDWAKAAKLYGALSKATSQVPPRVWLRLGASLRALGEYDPALAAFEKGTQGATKMFAEYGMATVYAAMKKREEAFRYLEQAIQQGYNDPQQLSSDASFAEFRADPRFAKLTEQARKNQKPCAYTAENRQFDFWVGEWNVETTQGELPAGTSKIELVLDDCVVLENWTSLGVPYSGKSYNTYNASLKRWEQFWVDNVGGMIYFYGGLKDGVMDYYTDEVPQPDGTKLKRHLQFFNLGPDKVRQFSQGSTEVLAYGTAVKIKKV